jgi:hypothetical protein
MTHALLVLGGGALAAPALRWAREAGLTVVATDPDPHGRARRLAHEFHPIPFDDVEAQLALARRLERAGRLAGIHLADPRALRLAPWLADAVPGHLPPRRCLEVALDPVRSRELWFAQGLPVLDDDTARSRYDVFAFFRDEAFVPGGIAERAELDGTSEVSLQPAQLSPEEARAAHGLVERAARTLGLERGPLQARLATGANGLALVSLAPAFVDPIGAAEVARAAHGKSPLQAWFAHLAGAGGPFDELPRESTAAAGWLALRAARAGLFAGIDGLARARALPGALDVWTEEPGREVGPSGPTCGTLWFEAADRTELEERLRAARAALEVRVACRQVA